MKETDIGPDFFTEKIKAYTFEGGQEKERKILLTAGVHGDEVTSIIVLKDLIPQLRRMEKKSVQGQITIIPVCNPEAFRYKNRESPRDSQDLNRVFPGDTEGSPTERIAASIWKRAQDHDYVLDLHGCGMECYPYILSLYEKNHASKLIRNIPHEIVVKSYGTTGQLFVEALNAEIPAAILEIGGGKGLIDLEDRHYTKEVVLNTLENLGFLQGNGDHVQKEFLGKIKNMRAQKEGVFVPKLEPGETIKKNKKIGEINGENITSTLRGKVIKRSPPGIKFLGDPLAGIAPFTEDR